MGFSLARDCFSRALQRGSSRMEIPAD